MPADPVIPSTVPQTMSVTPSGNPISAPLQGTKSAAGTIARVSYTHDAMCDLIIANPAISKTQIAQHFGYTPVWVSRVLNSDAFQMRLAARKADISDPSLILTIQEKLNVLIGESLDVLIEKLATTKDTATALKGLEIATKAAGYGARQQNVTVQQSFVVAMPNQIPDQAAWAQKHGGADGAIDVSSRTLDERLAEAEAAAVARQPQEVAE